jgi:hypothetical protein
MAKGKGKRPALAGQALKDFRHSVAGLKSKGLVSKRVDARSQKPTRYMQAKIKALAPVLEGKAAGFKVSPDLRRQYKEAGFTIANGRVVVDKTIGESASIRKGFPLLRRPLSQDHTQERLVLPYSPRNFSAFVDAIETNPDRFNNLKEIDETFAFTFFGNWSHAHFDDIELVLDYLMAYSGLTDDNKEAWKNFSLYRIRGPLPSSRKNKPRSQYGADGRRPRSRGKLMGPTVYKSAEAARKREARSDEAYRAKERERDKAYQKQRRATLTALQGRNTPKNGNS